MTPLCPPLLPLLLIVAVVKIVVVVVVVVVVVAAAEVGPGQRMVEHHQYHGKPCKASSTS